MADLFIDLKRARGIALNGAGILPGCQGLGGNALLYAAIEATLRGSRFEWAELPQVAETAVQMRKDLRMFNAAPIKTHRVYRLAIEVGRSPGPQLLASNLRLPIDAASRVQPRIGSCKSGVKS